MMRISSLLFFLTIIFHFNTFAQCPSGQSFVTINVTTDAWGYECFWDLTPMGSGCGVSEIFSYGNTTQVGCSGAGQQDASGGNGYANNGLFTESLGCIDFGTCFDINYVDDWGDGGATFTINLDGLQAYYFPGSGTGNVFSFCVASNTQYDASITANKYEYTKVPLSQVQNIIRTATISSEGYGDLSNAFGTVNVTFNGNSVFTANSNQQSINSGSTGTCSFGNFVPSTTGSYTVTYFAQMAETDENMSNNYFSYVVDITDSIYARDNGSSYGIIGIGQGEPGYLGNKYEIISSTEVSSISVLLGNTSGNITGNNFEVEVFAMDGFGNPTTMLTSGSGTVSNSAYQWHTIDMSPYVQLTPGNYLVSIKEEASYQQQIGINEYVYQPNTSYVSWTSQPWASTESLGLDVNFMIRLNVNQNAGLKDINANSFELYPNPVSEVLTLTQLPNEAQITIYSVVGEKIKTLESQQNTETIDISELTPGIYMIKVNNSSFRKFIKK
jgi:hypothetical protein